MGWALLQPEALHVKEARIPNDADKRQSCHPGFFLRASVPLWLRGAKHTSLAAWSSVELDRTESQPLQQTR